MFRLGSQTRTGGGWSFPLPLDHPLSNQGSSSPQGWLRLSQMECSAQPMRGGYESPDNPSSNREASGKERNRSDLKRVVVKMRGLQTVMIMVRAVCGPLRWLTVVVVTEQWWSWFERSAVMVAGSPSWAVDFGSWVRGPPWWFGVGVTTRGKKVPRPGSGPPDCISLLG